MAVAIARDFLNILPVGQLISIVPATSPEENRGESESYACRVEDILNGAVVVSMPMRRQSLVHIPLNSEVAAYFHRGGARYYFRAVVAAREKSTFPVLYLVNVGEMKRVERRSHVRIEALLEPIEMVVVDGEIDCSGSKCPSLVVNISAGGLGLVCRSILPVGTLVHIVLDLPNSFGRMEADARVVRSDPVELGGFKKWRVGVAFQGLPGADQDRVVAFVLYQQRLLRRRGLL